MSNNIETPSGVAAVTMMEDSWFGGLAKRRGLLFTEMVTTWYKENWYQAAFKSGLGA